jgi:long-chain acyl-CoA synthetase
MPTEQEAIAELTAPGARFEIEMVDVRGVPTKAFVQRLRSLRELAQLASGKRGDTELLVFGERRYTYRRFFELANSVSQVLSRDASVGRGDRVAILSANNPEWCLAFWGAVNVGAVAVALNGWWKTDEILYGLRDAQPRVLVADRARIDRIRDHLAELDGIDTIYVIDPEPGDAELDPRIRPVADLLEEPTEVFPSSPIGEDDPAVIVYTSGTTDRPKGAVATHRSWIASTHNVSGIATVNALANPADRPPRSSEEVRLLSVPLFHVSGAQAHLVAGLLAGWKMVMLEGRFDPADAMGLIEAEQVTAWAAVPTMASLVCHHPDRSLFDLSSVRSVGFGGAPVPTDLARHVREAFPNLTYQSNIYGLTETSGVSTLNGGASRDERPTAVGKATLTVDVEIRDVDGRPLPVGATGEICVRGPHLIAGYWGQPEATAATIVNGWLHTGDLGHLDADGYLYVTDRAKDLIIRGGENISSVEIEDRLCAHPAVVEAAVVGVPHPHLGETVRAVVHLTPGASVPPPELQAWVAETLADFKVPAEIEVSPEPLPRNETGKILKTVLRGGGPT